MSLKDALIARITADGPISIAAYMSECLLHPKFGYYTNQQPFGEQGDFITAPEISQMFGEVIGLCLAQAWVDQGRPARFTLAELGPGRGTLMADILRATATVPGFQSASQIVLVEASDRLGAIQRQTLSTYQIDQITDVQDLPDQPLYVVANEFFDALPIRQFVRSGTGWRERQIGLNGTQLALGLGPQTMQPALKARLDDTKDGDVIESAPSLAPITAALGGRIQAHGGAGLIIDYGDWRSLGDTLQAIRDHRYCDVLDTPGMSDLTAHVDFEALALAAPCEHSRLTTQGVFLERLGITQRAQTLSQRLTGAQLDQHIRAHQRLTHPDEMGNLFKVLGLFQKGQPPPAGLDV